MPEGTPAQDSLLTCVECGAQFVFSVRDQAFYQERGYRAPRRCKVCRDKRKSPTQAAQGAYPDHHHGAEPGNAAKSYGHAHDDAGGPFAEGDKAREQHKVLCSACGTETTVPFKPDPNRPVYCRSCYLSRRKTGERPRPGGPAQAPADPAAPAVPVAPAAGGEAGSAPQPASAPEQPGQ